MKRMPIILMTIISFLFTQLSVAATMYQPGDSMYVWAKSGLKMRVSPDLKGDKILTIPYGTKVKIDSYQEELPEIKVRVVKAQKIEGMEYKSFYLKGHWCRVTYLDTVGYIFDGYLSKMPTFELTPYLKETVVERMVQMSFEEYADKHFGLLQQLDFEKNPTLVKPVSLRKIYGNGMIIEEGASKGGWKQRIILPGMSFEEGFLFFSTKFNFEEFAAAKGTDIYPTYSVTKKRSNFVEIEGFAQTIQIREVDGVVVISMEEYEGC